MATWVVSIKDGLGTVKKVAVDGKRTQEEAEAYVKELQKHAKNDGEPVMFQGEILVGKTAPPNEKQAAEVKKAVDSLVK